jgi:hypothetical protein
MESMNVFIAELTEPCGCCHTTIGVFATKQAAHEAGDAFLDEYDYSAEDVDIDVFEWEVIGEPQS